MNSLNTVVRLAAPQLGYAATRTLCGIPLTQAAAHNLDSRNRRSAGLRNLKRPHNEVFGYYPANKKPRLRLRAPPPPKGTFVRMRRTRGRRFRRGRRRIGRRKRKPAFGRVRTRPNRMQKRMLAFTQTNKVQVFEPDFQFFPTDGTAVQTLIFAPFSYNIAQGVQTNQFIGSTIYLVGFQVYMKVYAGTDAAAQAVMARIHQWHMTSRQQSPVGAGGTFYNSTTTAVVQPAAVAPNENIQMFDGANPYAPRNWVTTFDETNVQVKKFVKTRLQTFGQSTGKSFAEKKVWYPINRKWEIQGTLEGALTAPFFGKWHTHYWAMQIFVGDPTMAAATESYQVALRITSYWKNVQ